MHSWLPVLPKRSSLCFIVQKFNKKSHKNLKFVVKTLLKTRHDFPILNRDGCPLIYLDSAATTQKPLAVIDAMHQFYLNDYATVHRGVYALCRKASEQFADARAKVQQFIHANAPEEIIFTRGTTA